MPYIYKYMTNTAKSKKSCTVCTRCTAIPLYRKVQNLSQIVKVNDFIR